MSALRSLDAAVQVYAAEHGAWPSNGDGLEALYSMGFVDPSRDRVDHWGTPYRFRATDPAYDLRSAGPDLTFETADDLTARSKCPRRRPFFSCSQD